MKVHQKQKLTQATIFLLCAGVAWVISETLGASEFSGGRVTGPLLMLYNSGLYLFVLALLVTARFQRVAAGIGIVASVVSLPLCLYYVGPGFFRRLFKGAYSVPLQPTVVWDPRPIAGILTLALALYMCVYFLVRVTTKDAKGQERGYTR